MTKAGEKSGVDETEAMKMAVQGTRTGQSEGESDDSKITELLNRVYGGSDRVELDSIFEELQR